MASPVRKVSESSKMNLRGIGRTKERKIEGSDVAAEAVPGRVRRGRGQCGACVERSFELVERQLLAEEDDVLPVSGHL